MKSLSGDEQSRRAKIFWDNISEEEYKNFKIKMKEMWTKEKREAQSLIIKNRCKNKDYIKKLSNSIKNRYNNLSKEERLAFKNKMKEVNNDIEKRLKSGVSLKNKWKDPIYLEKMKNRKKRPKSKYKIIFKNGDEVIEYGINDICEKYNLNIHLLRKFANTDMPVYSKNVNNKNDIENTIGVKFYRL